MTATRFASTLPEGVAALAVVTLVEGVSTARLRSEPGGQDILAAVPDGTHVQVMFARIEVGGVWWRQVRLESGQMGWMAEFLLEFTVVRP